MKMQEFNELVSAIKTEAAVARIEKNFINRVYLSLDLGGAVWGLSDCERELLRLKLGRSIDLNIEYQTAFIRVLPPKQKISRKAS